MRVREAIAAAARRLAAVSESAALDAELLMAHALGMERRAMLLSMLDAPAPDAFEALLARRLEAEPVAYITGRRAFWTIELTVGRGVLIPRPDSETLMEAAVEHFRGRAPRRILDLGTGPGTLLLAALAEWPEAYGLGIDASEAALEYAETNAEDLGLEERARFKHGDWLEGLGGEFDLILCNPPYVEVGARLPPDVADWEPDGALYAGEDGLADYRRIAPRLRRVLDPAGVACVEIGLGQRQAAGALFEAQGFSVSVRCDVAGIERCLVLRP